MRTSSKILVALPVLAAGYDAALWHFPFYCACAILALCLLVLWFRFTYWLKSKRILHRLAAACILAFCRPRKNHEPKLHAFCYGHA